MEVVNAVTVYAPAKLNLSLEITGRLISGYHTLKMLMQTVSLYDVITIKKSNKKGINITSNVNIVRKKEDNIAYKVAIAFFSKVNIICDITININKNIPMQAGLGGGSVDGAGVLVGLNKLFNTNLSKEELCEIGKNISADIPFCIMGDTAFVEGFGDIITPVNSLFGCYFVIVKPEFSINTKVAYNTYDQHKRNYTFNSDIILEAVRANDIELLARNMFNVFEHICEVEKIKLIKNLFMENEALGSILTGSGSGVFGVFTDKAKAEKCYNNLKGIYEECFLATTCNGIFFEE